MDLKQDITNVETLQRKLEGIEKKNGHIRDAIIRCTTLRRSLEQALEAEKADGQLQADLDKQVNEALGQK